MCERFLINFTERMLELGKYNLIKLIITELRYSSPDSLEAICEYIVAFGNDDLYNYILHILPELNLNQILTYLLDNILIGNKAYEDRVNTIINMGADINNINFKLTAIIHHIVYLRQLGFTDHFHNNKYIDYLLEKDEDGDCCINRNIIHLIRNLVEAGLDLNYIEERLGLK